MYLSHNIPLVQFMPAWLSKMVPQCKEVYAILKYENGSVAGHDTLASMDPVNAFLSFIQSANTGWYARHETPLDFKAQVGQVKLEGELERDHLFIRNIDCSEGQLFLLLHIGPVGMGVNHYLNSSEKKLIEQVIRNIATQTIVQRETDKRILQHIAKNTESLRSDLSDAEKTLEQRSRFFEANISQLLRIIVARLEQKYGITIHYKEDFVQAMIQLQGTLEAVEAHLDKQVEMESNLALLSGSSEIYLQASHLKKLKIKAKSNNTQQDIPMHLGRYTKTYQLLDRYEAAAQSAQAAGLSIIGKHIGEHCNPSISNAAITDALNKHARKIYELFERYPDKWSLLRNEFRSVANIMEKETERRKAL